MEVVVVRACHEVLVVTAHNALELVKDAVVLVQVAQLGPQLVVYVDGLHRTIVHVDVPQFEGQIVAGENVSPVVAKLDVRDGLDDLGEERSVGLILGFLEN